MELLREAAVGIGLNSQRVSVVTRAWAAYVVIALSVIGDLIFELEVVKLMWKQLLSLALRFSAVSYRSLSDCCCRYSSVYSIARPCKSPKRKEILFEKLSESAGNDLLAIADSGLSAGTEDGQCEGVIALRANKNRYHLPTLSDTRWLLRVDSISTLLSNYEAVHEALDEVRVQSTGQSSHDAASYLYSMSAFCFIVAAVICQYIFAFTRSLSVVLQSKECDLVLAHENARNLVAAIQSQRSDERFHLLYSRATAIASKVGVSPTKPSTVNRQVNRAKANVGGDIEVHYKVNFYYPFIDHVIQHLNDRFPDEIKGVLLASFLIPSKLHLSDETVAAKIEQSLGDELPNNAEFGQEVLRWKMKNNNSDAKKIQSLQHAVIHCNESFYPNISTILQLLLTLPVGSCSCERSFSSLRRLKTWSRTSMANARLNGLALAYIHKPTEIDSSSILKRWNASGHRRIAVAFSNE
ncbi:52 kDa repressor of the inhibitor of the protein kinase-like [Montipora foliosa]|uniref:52 kDa repressor of the inhibitor of the protein kinase-like n=1 Tax=Montipora foliosa TaxID=591990 RepID=UPI0035F1E4CE